MPYLFSYFFALGIAAASPQQGKGYSGEPARRRRERPSHCPKTYRDIEALYLIATSHLLPNIVLREINFRGIFDE
ncbi:hypothetical protein SAMN04487911_12621 [Arenibacter nanhaiticus]|uniref:Uncharacterized protein n=1 Tax=Arenibacter nanhaiticus TaxID=558155 RepID=A0A1M6KJ03_9FLAO|nr:hypothetical protein SAMN04487911_12621 [Arenibacter nanhaiticus]